MGATHREATKPSGASAEGLGVRSWSSALELESGRLDDWVDCVEIFMQVSRPHSSIIYSRSYTEGSDTFT